MPSMTETTIDNVKQNKATMVSSGPYTGFSKDKLPDLIDAIETNTSLKGIELINDDLTPYVDQLVNAINNNQNLQYVCINGNLDPKSVAKIAKAIEGHPNINNIDLDNNDLSGEASKALAKTLKTNKGTKYFRIIDVKATDDELAEICEALSSVDECSSLMLKTEEVGPKTAAAIAQLCVLHEENIQNLGVFCEKADPLLKQVLENHLRTSQHMLSFGVRCDQYNAGDYEDLSNAQLKGENPNLIVSSLVEHDYYGEAHSMVMENQMTAHNLAFSVISQGVEGAFPNALKEVNRRRGAIAVVAQNHIFGSREVVEKEIFEKVDNYIASLPSVDPNSPDLTPEDLIAKNENGNTALDNPNTWDNLPEIIEQLGINGNPLTLEVLQETNQKGASYLTIGVSCGQFGAILETLNATGQQIRIDDLLDDEGKPNQLLKGLIQTNQVSDLFQIGNWKGALSSEPREMYEALPENAQKQVDNLHALTWSLKRSEPKSARVR